MFQAIQLLLETLVDLGKNKGLDMKSRNVTIIIPVYNTKKYLRKCVESVITQTYKNLQIILVDDGSTDGSSFLCDELKELDSRIEVIHKDNEGLGLTRNKGLEYAKGEYVTFLDSDDWFDKKHIQNFFNDKDADTCDVILGSYTKATNQGEILNITKLPYSGTIRGKEITDKVMLSMIAAENNSKKDLGIPMSVCFNLYKLNIIKENKLIFPSERVTISEDLFFNLKYLSYSKKVCFTEEIGYYYRYNPDSITRGFDERQIERTYVFYQELIKYTKDLKMPAVVSDRIERCVVAKIRGILLTITRTSLNINQKIAKIKEILDEEWIDLLLKNYKMPNYRTSLRFTTYCMKRKRVYLLYIILNMKNILTRK